MADLTDDELIDLTEEQQLALLERTANGVDPADGLDQPPQDPAWVPTEGDVA